MKRGLLLSAVILVLVLVNVVSSQSLKLSDQEENNTWFQGKLHGIRIYYGYTAPAPENFHCRCDFAYDGSISLIAVQAYYHILPESSLRDVTTFYRLRPSHMRQASGNELVTISYKTVIDSDIRTEPTILKEDTFTKRCVPLLGDLFRQIPTQEVKMFKDQYGKVFDLK